MNNTTSNDNTSFPNIEYTLHTLTNEEKTNLVDMCVKRASDEGIYLAPANTSMAVKAEFNHPITNETLTTIWLDPTVDMILPFGVLRAPPQQPVDVEELIDPFAIIEAFGGVPRGGMDGTGRRPKKSRKNKKSKKKRRK